MGFNVEEQLRIRRQKVLRDGLIIVISILIAVLLYQDNYLENFLKNIYGPYFVLGSFLAGFFFASTFTVAISTSVFLIFAETHNPLAIAAFGGLGAFVGDSLIIKFLKDDLIADFEYLERYFPQRTAKRILHSKLTLWLAPVVAALMIASPIPDEIGLILLAGIKMNYRRFFLLSFFLNTVGILVISLFGKIT